MSQLEYGDYYKFAASAGIALLVAAGLLPWAFLRESFDLSLEASKIALLTPEAQSVISNRQHQVALLINVIPWVSVALALMGVSLTSYGLLKWRARQAVRDQGEDADVQKKLKDMSREQVEQKAHDDAMSLEEEPMHALTEQASTSANTYLAVESAVLSRLEQCYGPNIKKNQRLGQVEFDAIIRTGTSERIIVEVKYIRKGFRQGWLTESLSNLAARTQLYSNTFSRTALGVLLVVLGPESRQSISSLIAEESAKMRNTRSSRFGNLRISTLQEKQIASIPCQELKRLLTPAL